MLLPSKFGTFTRSVRFRVVLLGIKFCMQLNCCDIMKLLIVCSHCSVWWNVFYIWESSGKRYSKNSTWISHHFWGIRRIYSHWRSIGYQDKTDAIHRFIVTKWHSTATQIWVCICSGDGLLSIQAIISNQCWLIPSEVLWHPPVGNFTCNAPNIITSYVWKSLS